MLPILQFISEILWRCCYILESFEAMAPGGGLGLSLLGEPVKDLIEFAQKGRCYWPWLGPNIALDVFIFEQGILRENEPFNPQNSYFVRMYGMGIRDLQFLHRNPNERERKEQLGTLHRCHTLRSWLGCEQSADLTEQLEFCYFSMAASMKSPRAMRPQGYHPPGMETHERRIKARRREFKILKIMVDRIWQETELNEGRRWNPMLLRRRYIPATRETREGDWHLLEPEQQRLLLGGRSRYHTQHPEHARLLDQWLPKFVGLDPEFFVKLDADLYYNFALAPVTPPLRRNPYCANDPATYSALTTWTTWMHVKAFIDKFHGAIHFAPEGLEEFMEIRDFSALEKQALSRAYVRVRLPPRPRTAFEEWVAQLIQQNGPMN